MKLNLIKYKIKKTILIVRKKLHYKNKILPQSNITTTFLPDEITRYLST